MEGPEKSPYKSRGGLNRIWKACIYSFDGLVATFRLEAAFRQLLLLALILIPLAVVLPIDGRSRHC